MSLASSASVSAETSDDHFTPPGTPPAGADAFAAPPPPTGAATICLAAP